MLKEILSDPMPFESGAPADDPTASILRLSAELHHPNRRVAVLGCAGKEAELVKRMGHEVIGLSARHGEISAAMTLGAIDRGELVQGARIPLEEESVDVVLSFWTSGMPLHRGLLSEAHRVLRAGGELFVAGLNESNRYASWYLSSGGNATSTPDRIRAAAGAWFEWRPPCYFDLRRPATGWERVTESGAYALSRSLGRFGPRDGRAPVFVLIGLRTWDDDL